MASAASTASFRIWTTDTLPPASLRADYVSRSSAYNESYYRYCDYISKSHLYSHSLSCGVLRPELSLTPDDQEG